MATESDDNLRSQEAEICSEADKTSFRVVQNIIEYLLRFQTALYEAFTNHPP